MATTTVPAATPPAQNEPRRTRPPLWQAPLFVLGVGALLAVWLGRPFWPDNPGRRLDRDLTAARNLLTRPDGDADEGLRLAQRVLEGIDLAPERAGEAHLVAGFAHIRLAEQAAGEGAAHKKVVSQHWQDARQELEQAEQLGVPEEYRHRLAYRLAKVDYHTGGDVAKVIDRLEASIAQCDSRAEGYALLTQAYLRQTPPNLTKALEANRKLRDVAEATETELANAKLVGGELLLRQGKHDEARKALEKVGEAAPSAVVSRARLLRARSYQDDRNWSDAAKLYQVALADSRVPLTEPANVSYNLGVCYRQIGNLPAAAQAWQECLRQGNSPEALVAALDLAELPEPPPEKTIEQLPALFSRIRSASDWKNPLRDLNGVRASFERVNQALRQAGRHDLALRVLEVYEKVAVPGQAQRLRAEVLTEWARVRLQQASKAATPELAKAEQDEATKLFQQAAAASAEAARMPGVEPANQAKLAWASADSFLASSDWAKAVEQLKKALELDADPARQGEGWFRLGEAYRSQKDNPNATTAYRKSMEFPTRFGTLARFQLAQIALDTGDLDEAEAALTLNVKLLRFAPDEEALEKSLLKLGPLLYQRRNYRMAVHHLEVALGKFKEHPEAPKIRYCLADSYRQIAAQENQSVLLDENMAEEKRSHFQREHRRWLQKATEEFAELDKFLDSPAGKDALTAEQRVQVPFVTAKSWFNLGEYGKAQEIYERLITRYAGKVEGLDALGGAVSCHAALGQEDKVRQRLIEISTVLPSMEEAVRKPWEEWLRQATAMLKQRKPK